MHIQFKPFPIKAVFKSMKFQLLIFSLLFHSLLHAQLHVVRDPIACAYGLKNKENKWVVTAQYQEITLQQNGFFTIKEGDKWGILTRNGKQFLDPSYDQIYQMTHDRFILQNQTTDEGYYFQKNMGIMDTNKNWILPQEFSSIQLLPKDRYLLMKTKYSRSSGVKYQTAISNLDGKIIFPYVDGVLLYRENEREIYLAGDNQLNNFSLAGNVRFLNREGKPISDSTFDKASLCGENYTVVKNNKFGLFTAEGQAIVWPRFLFELNMYDYSSSLPCLHSHHQFIFTESGKKGIVNGSWKVLLAPEYQNLVAVNSQAHQYSTARYYGYRKEKNSYDLIDVNGKVLYEADSFYVRMLRVPKTNYYQADAYKVYFFFGKRENNQMRWGILNEKAEMLVPPTNAVIILTSEFEALLVESTDAKIPKVNVVDLMQSNFGSPTQATFITQMDAIFLFQKEKHYYSLYYDEKEQAWQQQLYGYNSPKKYGNLLLIAGSLGGYIYDESKQTYEKVSSIDLFSGGRPVVHKDSKMNIVHERRGLLFNEYYSNISQQFASKNRIWVMNESGKWKLFDTTGVQRIAVEFDAIPYDWDNMLAKLNQKMGLLDSDCNWLIRPVFSDLFLFTKDCYVGITPAKHVAVIRLDNPGVMDTSYTSFIPLYYSGDGNVVYYSLEKNGKTTCYDKDGKLVSRSKKELLMSYWTEESSYMFFYIQCAEYAQKAILQNHKELVYNYYYPTYWSQIQGNKSAVINGVRGTRYGENKYFKAEFVTSKALSLSITEPPTVQLDYGKGGGSNGYLEVSNWVLQAGGTYKKVAYTDLFNANSPFYQKLIVEAIQDNPEIRIDCNKPDFLFSGAQQFSFHKDGIKLYFFEGQSQAFELILNKTQLAKIPSAKWILGYLE